MATCDDAFGASRSTTGANSPFGFAGELLDPTSILRFAAEYGIGVVTVDGTTGNVEPE